MILGVLLEEVFLAITVDLLFGEPSVPLSLIANAGDQAEQFADELAGAFGPLKAGRHHSPDVECGLVAQEHAQSAADPRGQEHNDGQGKRDRLATHGTRL